MLDALAGLFDSDIESDESDHGPRVPSEDSTFVRAWEYETSTAKTNVVMCGRRGAKTSTARRRALRRLAQPGKRVLYITLIKDNCRDLFWTPLKFLMRTLGWSYIPNEQSLSMTLPNGSFLKCRGVDNVNTLDKIRGDNWSLVIIDECQANKDDILRVLVEQVLSAALVDQGGDLDLLGSAPPVDDGFFAEQFNNPKKKAFNWSIFANPFIPLENTLGELAERGLISDERIQYIREKVNAAQGPEDIKALEDELADLEKDNPIFIREYLGRLVEDPELRAYEFNRDRNLYDPDTVDFRGDKWRNAWGLDLGWEDHDAIVVGSWRTDDVERRLYVRFRWQMDHRHIDQLAGVLEAVKKVYPGAAVGDHGGHGATKVLETLKARLRVAFQRKPPDVSTSVGLVNDDFRVRRLLLPNKDVETARILAAHAELMASGLDYTGRPRQPELDAEVAKIIKQGGDADLAGELRKVTKTIDARTKQVVINKKGFHSDLSEANRYMHHAARHWSARAPKPEPTLSELRAKAEQRRRQQQRNPW